MSPDVNAALRDSVFSAEETFQHYIATAHAENDAAIQLNKLAQEFQEQDPFVFSIGIRKRFKQCFQHSKYRFQGLSVNAALRVEYFPTEEVLNISASKIKLTCQLIKRYLFTALISAFVCFIVWLN